MTITQIGKSLASLQVTEYFRQLIINKINRLAERCVIRGIQMAQQDEAWAKKIMATPPGKTRDTMLRARFDADTELTKPDPFCSPYQKATP